MRIIIPALPRPTPFNFLNGTEMRIVLNKRGRVGMRETDPEPVRLPFLLMGQVCLNGLRVPKWV